MVSDGKSVMRLLGAIEAGGTKFRCAVAETPERFLAEAVFPTRTPAETLADIVAFFSQQSALRGTISAIGIGSFGPLDLDFSSPTYGSIVRTPKPHWSGFNLPAALAGALGCKVVIDTDVNASGLGEASLGVGQNVQSLAYITVGTGIGGGLIRDGRAVHGFAHAEMGHIRPRRADGDVFAGVCPFHGDCLEGLASGAAIFARIGRHLADVGASDPVWRFVADYVAQLCASLVLMVAPHRIVLGGGVMASNPALFAPIRAALSAQLAGYCGVLDLASLVTPPALAENAGLVGGLLMAAS